MSHLQAPTPNPPLRRDTAKDLEWTTRSRTTEVCKQCFCRGCIKCHWTGFTTKKENTYGIDLMFKME